MAPVCWAWETHRRWNLRYRLPCVIFLLLFSPITDHMSPRQPPFQYYDSPSGSPLNAPITPHLPLASRYVRQKLHALCNENCNHYCHHTFWVIALLSTLPSNDWQIIAILMPAWNHTCIKESLDNRCYLLFVFHQSFNHSPHAKAQL